MKHSFKQTPIFSRSRDLSAHGVNNSMMLVFVFFLILGSLLPHRIMANEAPLDTLNIETLPKPESDLRQQGANIPISRKLLPEVQATTVPKTSTPKRPPRLDDPQAALWHEYLAIKAKQEGDYEAQKQNQMAAAKAEPENPRFLWPVIFSALGQLDFPTLLDNLPHAIVLQLQNPVHRGPVLIAAQQGILLYLGFFWTALVFALTITWWRYLAHDLSALLFRGQNHRSFPWLPILLPLAFLLFRPGWFEFLSLMSIPLLIQTRGNSRRLLAGTWVATIVLVFPMWPAINNAVPTIDPSSEVNLLVKATSVDASPRLRRELKNSLKGEMGPDRKGRLTVALAIQEARGGRYKTSNALFEKVLATAPTNLAAMVGHANNMYYLGRLDTAADLFYKASLAHPHSGLILHNQAQVFFKKLFIPEASAALDKSRDLGYHPPVWQNQTLSDKKYSPVVYTGLSNKALQQACAWESKQYAAGITLMTWNDFLGSPPVPLFLVMSFCLLLANALILLWSHQHDPRECENCGIALCGNCCVVRQDSWLCSECGGIVDRARSDMILATLLKNRSRSQGMSATAALINQGRFFPGAGHLAIDKTFAAGIRLTIVSCGAFLALAGWAFVHGSQWFNPGVLLTQETINPIWIPLPIALWEGWLSPLALFGGGLIVAAWLLAIFDGHQLRHQLPERFSLVLSSTRTDSKTTESHSVSVS